jgi:hypothetical protein
MAEEFDRQEECYLKKLAKTREKGERLEKAVSRGVSSYG